MNAHLTNLFPETDSDVPRAALFMSGAGSNAEKLLEFFRHRARPACRICVIATDAPDRSGAARLARTYGEPLVALDIREFYRKRGMNSISLATETGRRLREDWTEALRAMLRPHHVDFGIFAGFVPLTNLAGDFPCLNVHPADLTIRDGHGRRMLAGLHRKPMELALTTGHLHLRSSVILARPYTGDGREEMDSGFILGISPVVEAETEGWSSRSLALIASRRQSGAPAGGTDELARLASINLQRLKLCGDHVVFPQTIEAFARRLYATDGVRLFFRPGPDAEFRMVETVEFGAGAPVLIPPRADDIAGRR